ASWAWILIGCLSVPLTGASDLSTLYPPLWEESPGQLSDYKIENGKYTIDPWLYNERIGVYKILLNKTATYFAKFAPENEQNILWGLALQHGWQLTSGRLADPTRETNCGYTSGNHLCISVNSWWADINYFLSIVPFFAAVSSGIIGVSSDQVTILPPPKDQSRFCYDVSGCQSFVQEMMDKWSAFFQYMQLPNTDFQDLLNYLWDAHVSSLEIVSSFEDRFAYYAKPEVNFGKNWVVALDYLAAARLPTTLTTTHELQDGLPPRVMTNSDIAPFIVGFTRLQNRIQVALSTLNVINKLTGSKSLDLWKNFMKTQAARDLFLDLLKKFSKNPNSSLIEEIIQLMNNNSS
ncbi:Leg1-related protein, partial [Salmonella enterica]|nr:Leg1-related protein [Salmonella enterica]